MCLPLAPVRDWSATVTCVLSIKLTAHSSTSRSFLWTVAMSDSTAFSSTIPGGHEPGPVYSLPGAAVAGRTVLPAGAAAFAGSGGCGGGSPLQGSSTISAPTPSRKSRALRASRGNAQADASFHTLAPDEPRHAGVPPLWTLCDGAPRRAAAGVLATTCMVARARFSHCVLGATDSTVFRIITLVVCPAQGGCPALASGVRNCQWWRLVGRRYSLDVVRRPRVTATVPQHAPTLLSSIQAGARVRIAQELLRRVLFVHSVTMTSCR